MVPIPSSLERAESPGGDEPTLEAVLAELRALRSVQEEIVELLRIRPASPPHAPAGRMAAPTPVEGGPPLRSRRRKTVLLLDDDPETRSAARAALEGVEVPTREVDDGNAALALIARDKPDVIVMELAVGGVMPGKDVVNLIKATMEWVDIPIILYTRLAISNPRDVREVHGADDYVRKGDGGPNQLVSRVIAHFRRM
jgi:CheY-like chemotaxis protein